MDKKIDCRNMDCPQPVLETKKALDQMKEGVLEVLVNSISSIENVKRYAINNRFEVKVEKNEQEAVITIIKGYECVVSDNKNKEEFLDKTLFIKSDKVSNGELGSMLIKGFLKTALEFKKLPKNIIFVNEGVFLTTKNEKTIEILKEFEKRGVKIYSCGLCMNYFKINPTELKVGEIGNAYDTMDMLLHTQVISL